MRAIEMQRHREQAIVAGTATTEMIEAALAARHLSCVLSGPRGLFKRED
jgi:hypothetical protein